jgi:hypothetical protein
MDIPFFSSLFKKRVTSSECQPPSSTLDNVVHIRAKRVRKSYPATNIPRLHGSYQETQNFYDVYTVYTAVLMSETGWWLVSKRFSEYFSFRKVLSKILHKWRDQLYFLPLRAFLCPIISTKFPRRRLHFEDDEVVHERCEGLAVFLAQILVLRKRVNAPFIDKNCEKLRLELSGIVEEFLAEPSLATFNDTQAEFKDERCPICWKSYVEDDAKVFEFQCRHIFHQQCAIEWLERSITCPLCRQKSISGRRRLEETAPTFA